MKQYTLQKNCDVLASYDVVVVGGGTAGVIAAIAAAKKTGRIFTVEEHSVIGGLGVAVAEVLGDKCPTRIIRIGMNDVFGESGSAKELLHKYGLDAEGIATRILKEI